MARWLLILGAVLLLAVAAVLVAVPIAISREISPEGVARRASELVGQPVVVKGVELAFRPGLRIRAEGVTVGAHGSAEAVEVEIALLPLLQRRIEPAELHLVGARLPLERTPEGGFHLALLGRRAGGGGGVPPRLPALESRDAEIFVVNADGTRADAPVLRVERLELAPLAPGGRAPLRLDLAVDAAPGSRWALGEARLEGAIALREGGPAIESGHVEGRDARVRGLLVDRFEAGFSYSSGVVTIEELEFAAFGGTGSASGRLALGRPTRFEGELRAAGSALDALAADWRGVARPAGPPGRWTLGTARFRITAFLGGGATRIESGRVEGRDARVRGLRIESFSGRFGYAERAVAIEALEFVAYGGTGSAAGQVSFGPARFEGELSAAGTALADLAADWRGVVRPAGPPGRWTLGTARFRGTAFLGGGATRIESARLEGSDARLRGLRIDRFSGRMGYADSAMAVRALDFAAYGGTGSASGRVSVGPARFEGDLRLADVKLADLISDWQGRPFTGEPGLLSADARVTLPFSGLAAGTGQGHVALRGGRIPARSLFESLLGSLGRLSGQVLSVGKTAAPAPSRLERLDAGFALGDGRLHSDDLALVTDDYRWRARGSLGLDRSLDLKGPLQLTSRGLQRMLASGALPLPGATAVIPEIPLRVTGSFGAPRFAADVVGLPSVARNTLGGLVRGGGSVVKGAARGGESAVKGAARGGESAVKGTARGLRKLTDKAIGREPETSRD